MLGMAGVIKGLYGSSTGLSAATYLASDLANAASVGAVI